MPVTPQAVPHLEAKGHEAVHASNIGLGSESDATIINRAKAEGRVVVTADLDYPRLLALLEAERPGVVLFRGGSYTDVEMLALLDRVLSQVEASDLEQSITVVDRGRIRRRVLPILGTELPP